MGRRRARSAVIAGIVAVCLGLAVVTHARHHSWAPHAASALCFLCENGAEPSPEIATSPMPSGVVEELVSEPAAPRTLAVEVEHPGHEPPAARTC